MDLSSTGGYKLYSMTRQLGGSLVLFYIGH